MPTVVTGTLIDSLGQRWANAPVQFVFRPTPSTPGPYTVNGADFDKMPPPFQTDTNGAFGIVLPSNSEIQPALSNWQMIVGPNSTYPATVINFYVTGAMYDVSAAFTSTGAVKQVQSLPMPRAYQDSEMVIPPYPGQLYYNVTERVVKYWESGNWVPIGGSSNQMVYPPAGIGVSTGNSWAASIDPARIAYLDTQNIFTQGNFFNGGLQASSIGIAGNKLRIVDRTPNFNTVGGPNINSDGQSIVINPATGMGVYFNWDQGGSTFFGNGAQGAVGVVDSSGNFSMNGNGNIGGNLTAFSGVINHNLNVGSFQLNGTAPAGYALIGNGTSYVPTPINIPPQQSLNSLPFGVSKQLEAIYHNDTGRLLFVSGCARCNEGGHVGSVECLIGASGPTERVYGMTTGAEVNNGVISFSFMVPIGYFYQIRANTLTNGQGNGVVGINSWYETQIYLT